MKDKYTINEINICTFRFNKQGRISPNLNEYPQARLCVIDTENKIAIDVIHRLKYDYIETLSRLYFMNEASKKIKENKRAAIFPYSLIHIDRSDMKKAKKIINELENGYSFCDGNEVYNNEEYLELLEKENHKKAKILEVKKLIKRKI